MVSHVLRRASHTHTHTHMKRQIGRLIGCGTRLYMHMHACTYTCIRIQVGEHVWEVDGVTTDGLTLEQLKASIAGLRGSLVPRGDEG